MNPNCQHGHDKLVETPKTHEVRGERAQFTVSHTYKGQYPDNCEAPWKHQYVLYVDGQYIEVAEEGNTPLFFVLKDIAVTMNAVSR